jgi:two-component system phosphate regulon sensor histidine kinase PhoR
MPSSVIFFLIVLALLAAWFAWRYFDLRRRLNAYAKFIRERPVDFPPDVKGFESLSSTVHDIAETFDRKLLTLNGERDRLAALLDQMADGVLIADVNGTVQFANPAARRLFEIPDPLGHTVTEVLRNHQLISAWKRCRETNELQSESVEITASHTFLQLIAVPDRHGSGALLLVQDLTRVRRLETVRRDFISNISHELRTPLASLKALTETLQSGAITDPEAGPRFLDRMVTEVDALTQMTQELLDLSRIESGQVRLEFSSSSPKELLESAAGRMNVQADRAGLTLRVNCRNDLPAVRADKARLEQVLVNLIHNAVKFTRPGGEVVLSAEPMQGEILFAVKDTGVGIPADDVPRIFERFYRVDRSRAGSGTGLGLSIARHIVEAHSGSIWAESIEGRGSTFFFSIPIA